MVKICRRRKIFHCLEYKILELLELLEVTPPSGSGCDWTVGKMRAVESCRHLALALHCPHLSLHYSF